MSQHDFNIANQTFPNTRADINNALGALATLSSGATAPSTTFANMLWYDEANDILKMRNEANTTWINLFALNQVDNTSSPNGASYALKNVTYLTSGTAATYTTPTGVRALRVTLVGGGGGGGGVDGQGSGTYGAGGGGGAGQIVQLFISNAEASYTYTVGAGGSGGAAGNNNGSTGGSTVFAGASSTATAGGGGGGDGTLGSVSGATGTAAAGSTSVSGFSNSIIFTRPEPHVTRWINSAATSYSQGSSGSYGAVVSNGSSGATGPSASGYGAGGTGGAASGTATNYAGGNGSGGLIIIEELL